MSALLLLWVCFALPAAADLKRYTSRHYVIYTDVQRRVAADYARHMDQVFDEYAKRFSTFRRKHEGAMPLYLFRNESDYLEFLAKRGVPARNSGGMFVYNRKVSGLFVFIGDKSRQEVIETLQHEGFHQFAFKYIGANLPIWANEGLAQYFEDGIVVGTKMHLGLANARRLRAVQQALEKDEHISFEKLMTISSRDWAKQLNRNPDQALMYYAQSWTVAYFLIHAEKGRYRKAFENYLRLVSNGRGSEAAFRKAFGTSSTDAFAKRWSEYTLALEPDHLTAAVERLHFLGNAIRYLEKHNHPVPESMPRLKALLQKMNYRAWRSWPGIRVDYEAKNDTLFTFTLSSGTPAMFELLEASRDDLPPRIGAPGMHPEPMLEWSRDEDDELVAEVRFR